MAISEKQQIYDQLNRSQEALDYIRFHLPALKGEEKHITIQFVTNLTTKIEQLQEKVLKRLRGDETALPSINKWDFMAIMAKMMKTTANCRELSFKLLEASATDLLTKWAKTTAGPDLNPEILRANTQWIGLIERESNHACRLIDAYTNHLEGLDGGPIEGFTPILYHYLLFKKRIQAPFLMPMHKIRLLDFIKNIEACLNRLIERQEQCERDGTSSTPVGKIKCATDMRAHLDEAKISVFTPDEEPIGMPDLITSPDDF